ncbi:hypothetical protein [Actinomadura oligospora]|uniref:hypothetical protein n=1 Tax=Actinomadura oligospora TaxID=111804 RepID=UPI00047C09BD|nr:hypothetical protein [Actinomadura oligospora]
MRRILDAIVLSAVGQVNRLMFGLTRGRVVLCRSTGVPGVLLKISTPVEPLGTMVSPGCLPLSDDLLLVLARPGGVTELSALLEASTAVEAAPGPDETTVAADLCDLIGPAEQAGVLKQAMRGTRMQERDEVRRLRLTPVALLRLRRPFPAAERSGHAISVV